MGEIEIQISGNERDIRDFMKCNPLKDIYVRDKTPIVEINETKFVVDSVSATYIPGGRYLSLELYKVKEFKTP